MAKKPLLLAALLAFALSAVAQDSPLRDDHPERYVVQKGDTLWDISARFLRSPWLWPEVWHANPQIENPHLIYPGDVISLVYVDGEPRLALERESDVVKLSPRVRTEPHPDAITTIPLSAVRTWLRDVYVLEEDDLDRLPYIVAHREQTRIAATGDTTYARRLDLEPGARVVIVRPGHVYRSGEPESAYERSRTWKVRGGMTLADNMREIGDSAQRLWNKAAWWEDEKGEVLAYEAVKIGEGRVSAAGDPATIEITAAGRELMAGDVVLPDEGYHYDPHFTPRPAPDEVEARVVALTDGFYGAGQYQVVALNRGSADGVEVGHTFAVYHPGPRMRDKVAHPPGDLTTTLRPHKARVDLPDTYSAHVLVFRTFDRISYALVMEAEEPVKVYDYAVAP